MSDQQENPIPNPEEASKKERDRKLVADTKKFVIKEVPGIRQLCQVVRIIREGGDQMKTAGWIVFSVCQIFLLIIILTVWHFVKIPLQEILDSRTFPAETFHMPHPGESLPLHEKQVLSVDFAGRKIFIYSIAEDQALVQLYVLVPNEGYKPVLTRADKIFWTNSYEGKDFVYSVFGIDFLASPRWVKIRVEQTNLNLHAP
jgi:hypothetical protein